MISRPQGEEPIPVMELEIGSIIDGKVTGITKFGAFVSLPMGRTGLVHISEVAHSYVNDIREHLSEGQAVKVRVVAVDKDGRINLSIKKALSDPHVPQRLPTFVNAGASGQTAFEDKLKQFMLDSQNKMSDLNTGDRRAPRRGGRRY